MSTLLESIQRNAPITPETLTSDALRQAQMNIFAQTNSTQLDALSKMIQARMTVVEGERVGADAGREAVIKQTLDTLNTLRRVTDARRRELTPEASGVARVIDAAPSAIGATASFANDVTHVATNTMSGSGIIRWGVLAAAGVTLAKWSKWIWSKTVGKLFGKKKEPETAPTTA